MSKINISLILGLMFVFVACNDDPISPSNGNTTNSNANSNASLMGNADTRSNGSIVTLGTVQAVSEGNLSLREVASRMEMPRLQGGNRNLFIVHTVPTYGVNYCMDYSYDLRAQYWVAFRWDKSNSVKNTTRTDAWSADPLIPTAYQTDYSDHSGNGYTRGHMVASEDRVNSVAANQQTFYYSNLHPQSYDFNTDGIWWHIENKVLRNVFNQDGFRDTLYVVKGGAIDPGNYTMVNKLPVPKYFFMAVLCKKNSNPSLGGYKAIGFWMEHKSNTDTNYKSYAVSIDKLEQLTGFDFFCNLPDELEEKIESSLVTSLW